MDAFVTNVIEHKFFERNIKNDLSSLSTFIDKKYNELKKENWGTTVPNERPYDPGNHWFTFNIFNFYNDGIYSLKSNIVEMTKEACSYYSINYHEQKYYIHGWFNYYNEKRNVGIDPENLQYHGHGNMPYTFHGYYCLNAEPSSTYYKINDKIVNNINKNDKAILSKNGYAHAIGEWNQDSNRVTLAYNIVPLNQLDHKIKTTGPFIPL